MSEMILSSSSALSVPSPKEELTFRSGNTGDIAFIDELQKKYNKQLGFMPTMWLEGKIKAQQILVAEILNSELRIMKEDKKDVPDSIHNSDFIIQNSRTRVGYIIAQDRYLKRDELGIVYQLCVKPGRQRGFIGAALLKAQFDRSQYGCRLYCCWCAQDLEANHFWESMGFVPLAYRNGAEKKGKDGKPRVQIFWQKKIRGKDDAVNWWFPAKTEAGAMGADRLALPIPPGVHWSEVEPIEIAFEENGSEEIKLLEDAKTIRRKDKPIKPIVKKNIRPSRLSFDTQPLEAKIEPPVVDKPKRIKKPKKKIDPKFIAASRELRDRYLEQVNENGYKLESAGKYELTRQVGESVSRNDASPQLADLPTRRLLEAA